MLFLTSLFALNSNMMRLLGAASEAANASLDLQQRTEQVRLANWQQISDPAWVSTNLLGTMTDASVNLTGLTENHQGLALLRALVHRGGGQPRFFHRHAQQLGHRLRLARRVQLDGPCSRRKCSRWT